MTTDIPAGYKLTEVGVIPGDWSESTIGELIEFQGGSQPEKSVFSNTPRPGFVRLIQIRDYKSDKFEVFAPTALLRRFCDENDIMIGRYGPPVFQILRGLSGAYNVALIKAVPRSAIDREFAYYFLKQDSLFEFIDKLSRRSSGQTGVDLAELRQYPLPLPPLPEQRAIATALSDVDALLAKLDALIAKKRDLKQAAMQQLLTGQTRLPGFSGDWLKRPIESFSAFVTKGATPTTYGYGWVRDGVIFLRSECVSADGIDLSQSMFISELTHKVLIRGEVRQGDILMTITGNVGRVVLLDEEIKVANINQHVARIRICDSEVSPEFVFHWLSQPTVRHHFSTITTGQAYPQISLKQVRDTLIPLGSLAEQTAIATILTDMDAELAALQARRDKTHALKQGMMQALLTGRIRLV